MKKNPLQNIWLTGTLGVILTVILYFVAKGGPFAASAQGTAAPWPEHAIYGLRHLHFLFGITWIGLLYYFNLVQVPYMAGASAEAKSDLFRDGGLVRRALYYFRWSSVLTVAVGFLLLYGEGILGPALAFSGPMGRLGIGAWLGIIMMLNVWGVIWRNQKKVVGIVPATPEEKAAAGVMAGFASRINFMLSIPMLFFMEAGHHWNF